MPLRLPLLALALLALAACGGNKVRGDGPPTGSSRIPDLPGDAVPRPESRSRYGNGPVYELSLIHISEPTRLKTRSRMPSSA